MEDVRTGGAAGNGIGSGTRVLRLKCHMRRAGELFVLARRVSSVRRIACRRRQASLVYRLGRAPWPGHFPTHRDPRIFDDRPTDQPRAAHPASQAGGVSSAEKLGEGLFRAMMNSGQNSRSACEEHRIGIEVEQYRAKPLRFCIGCQTVSGSHTS